MIIKNFSNFSNLQGKQEKEENEHPTIENKPNVQVQEPKKTEAVENVAHPPKKKNVDVPL